MLYLSARSASAPFYSNREMDGHWTGHRTGLGFTGEPSYHGHVILTQGLCVVPPVQRPQIAVLGLGYVGCVSAACLSATGYSVSGIDCDGHKVRMILNRQAPFYEPGLEELVRDNVAAGRLSASTSLEEGIRDADIALICVGTPSERNGDLPREQLRRVLAETAQCLPGRSKPQGRGATAPDGDPR